MQSNNPVFRRSEEFNAILPVRPDVVPGIRTVRRRAYGGEPGSRLRPRRPPGRMTIDSVVQKTGDLARLWSS